MEGVPVKRGRTEKRRVFGDVQGPGCYEEDSRSSVNSTARRRDRQGTAMLQPPPALSSVRKGSGDSYTESFVGLT